MKYASTALELVGLAALVGGLYMLAPWLAVAVGGILCVGVGFTLGGSE
jgi:hypothetical protein